MRVSIKYRGRSSKEIEVFIGYIMGVLNVRLWRLDVIW